MKKSNIIGIVLSVFVLASCASSSDVVDGGLFQKRKYNKGWHFNKKSKIEKNSGIIQDGKENLDYAVVQESVKEENTGDIKIQEKETTSVDAIEETASKEVNKDLKVEDSKNLMLEKFIKADFSLSERRHLNHEKSTRLNKYSNISSVSNIAGDVELLILVILAIFIPPLAVGIYEGITSRFWITLILWLLAWGIGGAFLGFGLAGLFSLLAVIYALLIVLGAI